MHNFFIFNRHYMILLTQQYFKILTLEQNKVAKPQKENLVDSTLMLSNTESYINS